MIKLMVFIGLFILELCYFKIANYFNIVDRPNERSSHVGNILRGGGVIFYLAGLIYFIASGFNYYWFFLGLTMMALVSFMDDIFTLSNKLRLIVHFSAVLLMALQLNVFAMQWFYLVITFIIAVGIINAYNFMDGINGITACYSLAVGSLMTIVNQNVNFIDQDMLTYTMLGVLVFAFFNLRKQAKCFAGDVGSVSIAYILVFILGALILKTGNLIYFLFLSVYGIDTVWTIVRRLYLKENIFEPHRSHLYQLLVNEVGANAVLVSFLYGIIQFAIGFAVIYVVELGVYAQWGFTFAVLGGLSLVYLALKAWIIKEFLSK